MATATAKPATKICNRCYEERPISWFRRQAGDRTDRKSQCRSCFRDYTRARARRLRRERLTTEMAYVAKCKEADAALRAANKMIASFGGLEPFCNQMKEAHDVAMQQGKTFTATRILTAIARLMHAAQQLESQANEMFPDMSPTEIESATMELFAASLAQATPKTEQSS